MRVALVAVLMATAIVAPGHAEHPFGFFNPRAILDASQVQDRRGEPQPPGDPEGLRGWFCISYPTSAGLGWVCAPPIKKDAS